MRLVYSVNCPGCSKRIHAPSEDKRRAAVLRHVRNCAVLNFGKPVEGGSLVSINEVLPPGPPE